MPRKKKSANEMTDQEIMERAFSKRVVKEVRREVGADEPDENDSSENPIDKG